MNIEDSTKLVKTAMQAISHIELVPQQAKDSYRVDIYYDEQNRRDILRKLSRHLSTTSEETCPICLDTFKPNTSIQHGRRCQHLFHTECLTEWLKDESKECFCPICRQHV